MGKRPPQTGPEHYLMAQELLALAAGKETSAATKTLLVQMAQVHATLAVASATAD